jgi:hypothetical protein
VLRSPLWGAPCTLTTSAAKAVTGRKSKDYNPVALPTCLNATACSFLFKISTIV